MRCKQVLFSPHKKIAADTRQERAAGARSRTPAPPPFSAMNTTPPASSVACSARFVTVFGSAFPSSKRFTVEAATPAFSARSRTVQLSAVRPRRLRSGVSIRLL